MTMEVYDLLKNTDMFVIVSLIYYHGILGQLKCVINQFYASAFSKKSPHLKTLP